MAEHITIRNAQGTWVVRASGAVIGESTRALELAEGGLAPVVYFPRDDIAMDFLEASPSSTICPHKGTASYYSVSGPDGDIADAAWSYETPNPELAQIAGHLAFYPHKVTVEKL